MSRRDRLERRVSTRREWAASREKQAAAAFARGDLREEVSGIPLGQPILVGHHSERRHRRALERADNAMRAGVESAKMAEHHAQKAEGLERVLDTAIFSDDDNAIEALEARIKEREALSERYKKTNAAWRKSKGDPKIFAELAGISPDSGEKTAAQIKNSCYNKPQPHMPFEISNLRQRIAGDRKRLAAIKIQQARAQRASNSGGVVIDGGEFVRITFDQKPDRCIINDLKAARFHWSGGSWCGYREQIPASVADLVTTT